MTGWRRVLRLLTFTALALVAYFTVPVSLEDENLVARAVTGVLALLLLAGGVIWQIVVHVEDENRQVDGLLLALVVAVLAFALAFYRLATSYPGEIVGLETRVDALYFTMTTLLTVGYGDIHAQGQVARGLVLVAMVFNVLVIATAVSTVTTRVRKKAEERAEARRADPASGAPAQRRTLRRKPR